MQLRAGFVALALQLQEAADMAHSSVRDVLRDAVSDAHRGSGNWAYYQDHTGDGESGDCIYSCDGATKKAPYEIKDVDGKKSVNLITSDAKRVTPVTTYHETADDDATYTAMEAATKAANTYTDLPVYERFISKAERDKADSSDFAGKNRSFPILKAADVQAAVHAMGRAGSDNHDPATLKANIIRIAKAKGFASELPKAWQGKSAKEAAVTGLSGDLKLTETTIREGDEVIDLFESAGAVEKEIKIIAPGDGSSAHYTESALKTSGPKVFTRGTQMFINHATKAEESQRPEGDWYKLAGALTTDAVYKESHPRGAGLYAMARFAGGLAPEILEKAKLGAGISIRANGRQATEAGRPATKNGRPILAEFTSCESIDIVTKAGAGGMILTEAARTAAAPPQENEMTEEQIRALVVSEAQKLVSQDTLRLHERALRGDASVLANKTLSGLTLPEPSKQRVIDSLLERALPKTATGELDEVKFAEAVNAEAKKEAAYVGNLLGSGRVAGMGVSFGLAEAGDPAKLAEARKQQIEEDKALDLAERAAMAELTGIRLVGREEEAA